MGRGTKFKPEEIIAKLREARWSWRGGGRFYVRNFQDVIGSGSGGRSNTTGLHAPDAGLFEGGRSGVSLGQRRPAGAHRTTAARPIAVLRRPNAPWCGPRLRDVAHGVWSRVTPIGVSLQV